MKLRKPHKAKGGYGGDGFCILEVYIFSLKTFYEWAKYSFDGFESMLVVNINILWKISMMDLMFNKVFT